MEYSLEFNDKKYTMETVAMEEQSLKYRAFEDIVYVKNPINEQYQILSIYVPEVYYEGKSIGTYNLRTAPIFFPNTVGGYMPGRPERPGKNFMGKTNAAFFALQRGYIVVSPGVRGRGLTDEKGKYTGVAPACIVDLKAAVRYLRYNLNKVPGDVEKIISNGTSAGGALSSLLGVTGNHSDYDSYFKELGAADERDDIFAASCYCPITNLDHADMAYEWEFHGFNDYHRMKFEKVEGFPVLKLTPVNGEMTELQIKLSSEEKGLFPEYLNSLGLKTVNGATLELDANGDGSFKNYVKEFVKASAQKEVDKGTDLSGMTWMTIDNGNVVDVDFHKYVAFRTRMKETPAFDDIAMETPENELFGSSEIQNRHFTRFGKEHSTVNGEMAEQVQIKMMNPIYYIGDEKCSTAKYFRIRHGAIDRDTSLAVSAILTAALRNHGIDVDYHLPWGVPHSGDYDIDELFAWMENICANKIDM